MQTITQETIIQTRQHFADNHSACIEKATSGEYRVNDLAKYVAWQKNLIEDGLAGKHDRSFTFQQRAAWLQTGECVPFLPAVK